MMVLVNGEEVERPIDYYDTIGKHYVPEYNSETEIIQWCVGDIRPHIIQLKEPQK